MILPKATIYVYTWPQKKPAGVFFQVGIKLLLDLQTLGIHLFKENKWRKII